jgi:hypothetical protein
MLELVGFKEQATEEQLRLVDLYERAFGLYMDKRFLESIELLQAYLAVVPGEVAAEMLRNRCEGLVRSPPDSAWTGAIELDSK